MDHYEGWISTRNRLFFVDALIDRARTIGVRATAVQLREAGVPLHLALAVLGRVS